VTVNSTAWWLGRHGLQVFDGKEPKQINQVVIQDFNQINVDAAVNTCLGYDAVNRVLYCSFPTGIAVDPNFIESMSFRLADQAYNVPDPIHVSAISGKIISTDLGLKFTPMQLSVNSMQMCNRQTQYGITKVMTFAGGKAGPLAADAFTTAASPVGDILISITPEAQYDCVIVATSNYYNTGTAPSGWTKINNTIYFTTAQNTDEVTFDQPSPDPATWTAVAVSYATTATPAVEQSQVVDFGTQPLPTYATTLNAHLNAGDTIIWQFIGVSDDVPNFEINDTQGNLYALYQNTQSFGGGLQYTAFIAVAVGCKAGPVTVNAAINNFGPDEFNTQFTANVYTMSGLEGPVGYGQLYMQDFVNYPPTNPSATEWNCTDDDYGQIFSEYQTYFFFSHDVEQQPNLSLYRKLFCYMSFHAVGVGDLTITPYVDSLTTPWTALPAFTLQLDDPGIDYDLGLDITGNRCSFKYSVAPTEATGPTGPDAQASAIGTGATMSVTVAPENDDDFIIALTNNYEANTPDGWSSPTGGLFTIQPNNANPVTFTTNSTGISVPNDEWAVVIASFQVNGTPTQAQTVSFGSGSIGSGPHSLTFEYDVPVGDIIIVSFCINTPTNVSYADLTVTDNSDNEYQVYQIGQNFNGEYVVGAFLAVAMAVQPGTNTVTVTLPFNIGGASGAVFDYSGILPRTPQSTDAAFWLTHMIVSARKDNVFPVRGAF
jgi:hypothetical protein